MHSRGLIVDDDESVCRLMEMSLRFAGIEAVSARNGMEALQVLQRADYLCTCCRRRR